MASFSTEAEREAALGSPWTWQLATNTVDASPGYRRLLGLSMTSLLRPFHILPLLAESERERVLDGLFRTMAGEPQDAVTFTVTLPGGARRLVTGTARVILGDDGAPVRVQGRLRELARDGMDAGITPSEVAGEREPIMVAIVGSDRLARLGIRSLLSSFLALKVEGEYAPTPETIASLRAKAPHWRKFAAVIVDVGAHDEVLAELITRLHGIAPGTKIVARIQPQAFEAVGWLARAGVSRLVTSEVSDSVLAQILMDTVQSAPTQRTPGGEHYLTAGESSAFEIASSLSEAEMRVLRMLARGYRNREIAGSLFVSEPTVKRYTQQIYRKLGARDRAHAAALANRLRLG